MSVACFSCSFLLSLLLFDDVFLQFRGVVAQYKKNGHTIPCFDAAVVGDVPLGGGLSSSASLEVRLLLFVLVISLKLPLMDCCFGCSFHRWPLPAFWILYLAPKPKPKQLLNYVRKPNTNSLVCLFTLPFPSSVFLFSTFFTFFSFPSDVPCGLMDQSISAMGQKGHALLLDCRDMVSVVSSSALRRVAYLCCVLLSLTELSLSANERPQHQYSYYKLGFLLLLLLSFFLLILLLHLFVFWYLALCAIVQTLSRSFPFRLERQAFVSQR
jgi:hypothetical protein